MIKFIKINIIILLTIIAACSPKKEEETEVDSNFFYDVVYETVATRENSTYAWQAVSGTMRMKFTQNTEDQGTFQFYYRNYYEPQFVYSSCTAGYSGNFTRKTTSETTNPNSGYNVLDPYVPPGGGSTTPEPVDEDEDEPAQIQIFEFTLRINNKTNPWPENCRQESDRDVILYRFANGEVIMKSEYRDLKLRPVLTSDPQLD